MDNKAFKIINTGVCAYFLVIYSCMMFLLELWYSSSRFGMLISSGICLLMILTGLFLYNGYKIELKSVPDDGKLAVSASVKLLAGSIVLINVLQLMVRQLSMSLMRLNTGSVLGILFFLSTCFPFLIISAILIRKGIKAKTNQAYSSAIDVMCCRVIFLYLLSTGIYQLLVWALNTLTLPDYFVTPFDLSWNAMPLSSIAAALIIYFVPLRRNRSKNDMDYSNYRYLSYQSCVTGGYFLLITGLFELFDRLLPDLVQMVIEPRTFSGAYSGSMGTRPFVEFAPAAVLTIISILIIYYGKKKQINEIEDNK